MIGVGSKITLPYIRPRLILFVLFPISKQKWQISPSLWASRAFPIKRSISDWGFKWSCGRIGDSALAGNCCHFRIWWIGKRNSILFPGVKFWWTVLDFNWHSHLTPLFQLISCWRDISFNIHSTERHCSVVFNIRELKFHLWEGYKFNRMGVGGKGTANCLFTKNRKKKWWSAKNNSQ